MYFYRLNILKHALVTGFALLVASNPAFSRNYYVDSVSGDDNNPGSSSFPWKSIEKINVYPAFRAGDSIFLKRGGVWQEKLILPESGTNKKPITISAYGVGPKPVLDGLSEITPDKWFCAKSLSDMECAGDKKVWYLSPSYLSNINSALVVYEGNGIQERMRWRPRVNGTIDLGNHEYSVTYLSSEYNLGGPGSTTFYVRSDEGMPDQVAGIRLYTANTFPVLIDTNEKNFVTIENLAVRGAVSGAYNEMLGGYRGLDGSSAILLKNSSNITLRNNEVYYSRIGIGTTEKLATAYGEDGNFLFVHYSAYNCLIAGNNVHDNSEAGIYLRGDSSYNTISSNSVHHNYDKGDTIGDLLAIGVSGNNNYVNRAGNIIESNEVFSNGTWGSAKDPAIAIYQSYRTDVRYNNIHDNSQGAVYFAFNTHESSFYYNIIHNNRFKNDNLIRLGNGLSNNNNVIANNTVHANTLSVDANKSSSEFYGIVNVNPQSKYGVVKNNILTENIIEILPEAPAGTRAFLLNIVERKESASEPVGTRVSVGANLYYGNRQISLSDPSGDSPAYWRFKSTTRQIGAPDIQNFTCDTALLNEWMLCSDPQNDLFVDTASIGLDPLYVDPSTLPLPDLHLSADSKAIDSGVLMPEFTSDYDGNAVPNGVATDIGAYEY